MGRALSSLLVASTLGVSGVGACVGDDPELASAIDAGAPPDATADTGGEADAGSVTTFCSAVDAAFCADFDRDPDAGASFARLVARGGATLERTVADYASPPGSLWIRLPAADGGYATSGFASTILDVSASQHRTVEVEVALRADEPSTGKVQFLTIALNGSGNGGMSLSRLDGVWGVQMSLKGTQGTFYPLAVDGGLGAIPLTFRRLRLEGHFANGGTGYGKLFVDDVSVFESPLQQTTTETTTNTIEIQLMAASATGPTPPVQAKYDNVVIRTRP